jgi:hypothetical protein
MKINDTIVVSDAILYYRMLIAEIDRLHENEHVIISQQDASAWKVICSFFSISYACPTSKNNNKFILDIMF